MNILSFMVTLLLLSGCGIQKMFDMPDKMDSMNKKMDQMTEGMEKTNSNMGQMINLMGKTVKGVDKQKVLLPFQQLMDEKNYDLLSPIPSKLMPLAKEFAEAIPAKDFAEISYLWLKEIKEVNPMKKLDKDGNEIPFNTEEITKINNLKLGRLSALQAVCGFLPDEKLNSVIEQQLVHYGRFEKTVYKILMMRVQFILDIMLNESLLSEPLTTVGEIKEAVMYASKLDFISRMGYAEKIAVKVEGFLAPLETFEEKLNINVAVKSYKKIKLSVDKDFKLDQQSITGDQSKDQEIYTSKLKDFQDSIATINESLNFWEAKGIK